MKPEDDKFVTRYVDKQPTDKELTEIELALNSRAPEWGEYELSFCNDEAVNMERVEYAGERHDCPDPEAVKALKFLIEGLGYKVVEVAS